MGFDRDLSENDALVRHMVERFLRWRLPDNFNPDGGIHWEGTKNVSHHPTGTNLFDYQQAEVMVKTMLFGGPK